MLWHLSNATTKAFIPTDNSPSTTNGHLCCFFFFLVRNIPSTFARLIKDKEGSCCNEIKRQQKSRHHITFFKRSNYSNASFITATNLCSGPKWADENWPITGHKPVWFNYAQWVIGLTGRWQILNGNEGRSLVKPPLFVYCGSLSSFLLLLFCKRISHRCCWNLFVGRVVPAVEILSC